MATQHLNQYSLGVIGGYQLHAGSSAQEFGWFLKTLEAAGRGTKTLWAKLVRQVYDKIVLARNFCSIGIVLWVLSQLGYNGTQIVKALKDQAYKLGIATILRAFCCGIAAFILNPKYDNVPVNQVQRLPRRDSARDVESAHSQEGLHGDTGLLLDRQDRPDRL